MKLMIAAGGTGGHIFPALSVAQEWRERAAGARLHWIGTARSRERELCERHDIPLTMLEVRGMRRTLSLDAVRAVWALGGAVAKMKELMRREGPDALLAFGGYVSAPALVAAKLRGVPYFLHEQNTVPGLVNRLFSRGSRCTFLGFTLAEGWKLNGPTRVVGTPVRKVKGPYPPDAYPPGLDLSKKVVLICGGSQGALSMNRMLQPVVEGWLDEGMQVVWQTGTAGYPEVRDALGSRERLFLFESIPDLYPYYAQARVVVGRSGASTIAETAYFGLPCVLIPLPWSSENHQWMNAGAVEGSGWGVRVRQDERGAEQVDKQVRALFADAGLFERMSRKALDFALINAARVMVDTIRELSGGRD